MQTLQQQQVFRIEEIERKDCLLEISSYKYCRAILGSIRDKPRSIIEITSETNISMSTAYRRVQNLHDSKLLRISGTITDEGKILFMYKSKFKGIQSRYSNGKTEVNLIHNN